MNELNIYQRLSNIQNELVVTKNQRNTFGNYNFRSAEDILEAMKPICRKHDTVLVVSDTVILVGDRNYIEATATLHDFAGNSVKATASAREALVQKGMQDAQITGSSSSYARKYALGGLLNLDDNKDPDATNKHGKDKKKDEPEKTSSGYTNEKDAKDDAIKKGLESINKKLEQFENIEYKDEVIKNVCGIYEVKKWEDITFNTNDEYKKLLSIVNQELQKEKDLQQAGI